MGTFTSQLTADLANESAIDYTDNDDEKELFESDPWMNNESILTAYSSSESPADSTENDDENDFWMNGENMLRTNESSSDFIENDDDLDFLMNDQVLNSANDFKGTNEFFYSICLL